MKILIATSNQGKVEEIKQILKEYEIISLKEIKCEIEIEEDGKTFEENAIKKACQTYEKVKIPCIADDSGIEIEKLNGWPGVKTANIVGKKRKAKHITCIAYCDENSIKVVRGEQEGYIATSPKGENGFGFDEIFELEDGRTMAEISKEEKNQISSRKKALEKICQII